MLHNPKGNPLRNAGPLPLRIGVMLAPMAIKHLKKLVREHAKLTEAEKTQLMTMLSDRGISTESKTEAVKSFFARRADQDNTVK